MTKDMTANGTAEAPSVFRANQHRLPFRLLIRGFLFSTKYLPVRFLRCVGMIFAFLFMAFNPGNFAAVKRNMRTIAPGLGRLGAHLMAARMFINYAYYLIDLFYISHDEDRIKEYAIEIGGIENIKGALKTGRGLIFLTTHLGNWEMGAPVLSSIGCNTEINLIYSPDSLMPLEAQRRVMRSYGSIREILLRPGEFQSFGLLRILREGGVIALQGDRLLFDRGVSVPFFGKPATFPKGPVKLAMLSNGLVLPVFMPMTGYKSYRIIIERPIEADGALDLEENIAEIAKVFEKYIALYPSQWFAFAPFWNGTGKDS